MFERIKKALLKAPRQDTRGGAESPSQLAAGPVSEWASTRGFELSSSGGSGALALEGRIQGKRWRMELGRPSRDYISGEELRGRAALDLERDVSVLVLKRTLKEALEKRAHSIYTDRLTPTDLKLPEEMRWLAMYDEIGSDSLPPSFWETYAVLTDRRDAALAWIDPALAAMMVDWPRPGPGTEVPLTLMLMRGKCYLRMQYEPPSMATLQHAVQIFTSACESAVGGHAAPADRP